jgi:hypothetical protein
VYAPHKLINPTEHVNWQLGDVYEEHLNRGIGLYLLALEKTKKDQQEVPNDQNLEALQRASDEAVREITRLTREIGLENDRIRIQELKKMLVEAKAKQEEIERERQVRENERKTRQEALRRDTKQLEQLKLKQQAIYERVRIEKEEVEKAGTEAKWRADEEAQQLTNDAQRLAAKETQWRADEKAQAAQWIEHQKEMMKKIYKKF